MSFYRTLAIALLLLFDHQASASSCKPGQEDPYQMIDSLYEYSELVFYGESLPGAFRNGTTLLKVISKWKGPNIDEVPLEVYERQPDGAPYFASPSEVGQGWVALGLLCAEYYLPADDSISAYLTRTYGEAEPHVPDSGGTPVVLLVAGLFLGSGAIAIWTWSARKV